MAKTACMPFRRAFLYASVVLVSLICNSAVAQMPTATISGVVEDATGTVIPGVQVTVTNTDTGISRGGVTARDGSYRFPALQVVINRKDVNGKVWGSGQRISRREALYTYTRWSSEYLLREDHLGSVEPKKAADFTVLNRDYLTVPEDEIGRLDPVLTVMGGKITYTQPEFAASNNLPQVGYQGDRSWWKRGTPEDATRGRGPQ